MSQPFLDFDDPPVIETVLGVEFAPLNKWSVPHFGLFWSEIKAEYPRFEVHPPLDSQIEQFSQPKRVIGPTIQLRALAHPPMRCWFVHESESRLLQVQHDHLVYNWRKTGAGEAYPHYEQIRPTFEKEWKRFCTFLENQEIGRPVVRQCEITYVNHLDPGKGWETMADLPNVIGTRIGAGTNGFLPTPESIGLATSYILPAEQGRLHVQLQSVIRHSDAAETLQLTLTARGRPASSQVADLLRWFDFGREWVVRGFVDFTASHMHHVWKRKQ